MYGIPQSRRGQRSLSITVNTVKNREAPTATTTTGRKRHRGGQMKQKGETRANDFKDDDARADDPFLDMYVRII